jgi:AcrR family transcriptional regulator
MKEKIIAKATEMFLKLGFKSVTMDDIACEMCISKKTIYKFFMNKELLIEEGTEKVQTEIRIKIVEIQSKEHNAIEENFVIRRMFSEMFKTSESPLYQLKKHYPQIHDKVRQTQIQQCGEMFRNNIIKGIQEGLYRENINVDMFVKFYYELIFSINENTQFEKDIEVLELQALEYHIRAMATSKGIIELEKQLLNPNT